MFFVLIPLLAISAHIQASTTANISLKHNENFLTLTMDDFVQDLSSPQSSSYNPAPIDVPQEVMAGLSRFTMRAGMDELDCFGLNPTLGRFIRWMFKPQSANTIDIKFYLTTRKSRKINGRIKLPLAETTKSFFNATKDTVLIIHGWMSNSNMSWIRDMENALLDHNDVNVIAVDWGGGSLSWKYWRAVGNTRKVGQATAELLQGILKLGLTRQQIHCIGHSLGAHICSHAANKLGVFGRITGLDPAQPCFEGRGLTSSDALYVDVVHTNADLLNKMSLGRASMIGTVDFYPNGGQNQPGCSLRDKARFSSWLPKIRDDLETAVCSHGRSYQVFTAAIQSNKCKFWGHSWDLSPLGALQTLKRPCTPKSCIPLGLNTVKFPGKGSYYLPTLDKAPYCVKDVTAEKQMSMWQKIMNKFTTKLRKLQKKWET